MKSTRPLSSAAGLAVIGMLLAACAGCAGGYGAGGYGERSGRAPSSADLKKMDEVRATADRMVADAKAASASRVDKYWRDAKNFKDIRDKVCKATTQPESKDANPAKILSMIKSIQADSARLRTVTMDAASRVERRSGVNDALIASQCRSADLGMDAYFQCSSMEHARAWHQVIVRELSDLNTINDSAAGWAVGSLECLEAALTRRLEKDDLALAQSILKAWTGYKNSRISSAQDLDDASLQFALSK